MRKFLITVSVFLFSITAYTVKAQHNETRKTGDFHSLSITGKIRLEIYPASGDSLVLSAEGATTDYIISENTSGELNIRLKTDIAVDAKITAKLYFKDLKRIDVQAGALVLSPDTIKTGSMNFSAKSGAKIELHLNTEILTADVKQGAILVLYGKAQKQEVSVSSSGTYSAFELEVPETVVRATTAGRAKVTAAKVLNATANTKGYIAYKGNPESKDLKATFGGEVVDQTDW